MDDKQIGRIEEGEKSLVLNQALIHLSQRFYLRVVRSWLLMCLFLEKQVYRAGMCDRRFTGEMGGFVIPGW